MTQDCSSLLEINDCIENEHQTLTAPALALPQQPSMLAYSQINNQDPQFYQACQGPSLPPTFTYNCDFTTTGQGGSGLSVNSQQYAYHPQQHASAYNYSHLGYLPISRPSLQLDLHHSNTMAPHMLYKHEHNPYFPRQTHNSSFDISSYSPEPISRGTGSPQMPFTSSSEQYCPVPTWPQALQNFALPEVECDTPEPDENFTGFDTMDEEEDEDIYDKPYAQLIYEALLQAPGNRMLLRDIYDWFIQNTRKPRDSGTNGWQNSIRHNLSMNQAFENDKNDPAASRGARKANSMWVLTEHAKKYGVQSTTRYRKTGAAKKGAPNRTPAIQRQRSGAKGGKAARRAARLKRQGAQNASPYANSRCSMPSTPQDEWSSYTYSPVTPSESPFTYALPHRSHFGYDQGDEDKFSTNAFLEDDEHLRQILQQPEPTLEDFEQS